MKNISDFNNFLLATEISSAIYFIAKIFLEPNLTTALSLSLILTAFFLILNTEKKVDEYYN